MSFVPTKYEPYDFANRRHIGPSPAEIADMLEVIGVKSLDDLIDQTVPDSIRQKSRWISASLCRNATCFGTCVKSPTRTKFSHR